MDIVLQFSKNIPQKNFLIRHGILKPIEFPVDKVGDLCNKVAFGTRLGSNRYDFASVVIYVVFFLRDDS